jgi:uncharacterized protein (TIRG00374 family)
LRIAFTLLLCALLLIYVVDPRAVLQTLLRCDPLWAAIVIVVLTLDRILMSFKWGLLLAIRGHAMTLWQRLMVYCSSMMWGLALPSTVGADGIRVILVRRFGVRTDDAVATIMVERGIGFVCALLSGLIALLILQSMVPHASAYRYPLLAGFALLLGTVAILMFSFSARALESIRRLMPRRLAASRAMQLLERLHLAYRSLAVDRPKLAAFSVLTLLEQLLMILCYWLVARALGLTLDGVILFAAVALAILVSRLPISIDGIGVYEGIFIAILNLAGIRFEDALAISIAARALQILVWLPWWLALMARMHAVTPENARSDSSSA